MFLEEKTLKETGKTFEECVFTDSIWIKCDFCHKEFTKKKGKYIESQKKCITKKDCCSDYSCRKKKQTESCLQDHGVTAYSKIDDVKEKASLKIKSKSKEIQEKARKTNLEKYGFSSYSQTEEFKKKHKETCLKRHGVSSPMQSEVFKEKQKNTNIEKYGVENVFQREDIKDQIKDYNIKTYGVEQYVQSEEYKKKVKETSLERYGTDVPLKSNVIRKKIKDSNRKKFGTDSPLQNEEIREKIRNKCIELYGQYPVNAFGKTQREIKDWLNSFGYNFIENDWSILKNKEIDLYCKESNLAIEYCGLYWHNEYSPQPRDRKYHLDKYLSCLDQGIRLITIFEDEWKNRQSQCKNFIKSILKSGNKVHGRSCEIRQITFEVLDNFLENNHIQGKNTLRIIGFGLFFKEELVGVISLGRHHRKKDNNIVLDRLCFKDGVQVTGGASKLFKKCIEWSKVNKYEKIISWSDNRWSQGNIYEVLGFKLTKVLSPDYSYVNIRKCTRVSKQSCRKNKTDCPPDIKEKDWMFEKGFLRIWDCGKKHWEYELNCN